MAGCVAQASLLAKFAGAGLAKEFPLVVLYSYDDYYDYGRNRYHHRHYCHCSSYTTTTTTLRTLLLRLLRRLLYCDPYSSYGFYTTNTRANTKTTIANNY